MEILARSQYQGVSTRRKVGFNVVFAATMTAMTVGMLVGMNFANPELPAPIQNTIPVFFQSEEKNPFAELYYYEADKQDRYAAYQSAHPDLLTDEVVWRVNAGLDNNFYTNITAITDTEVMPIIVNKYHQLAADYVPPDLVKLPSGKPATKATCTAYKELAAAARKEGLSLYAASAYRSYELQNRLYTGYLKKEGGDTSKVDTYSARPGHSEHQTGRAIDLCGSFGSLNDFVNTPEGPWIDENCYKYGFIVRYQQDIVPLTGYKYEPWHITYVGKDVAIGMREQGITCLEEYIVKYIDHQPPTEV